MAEDLTLVCVTGSSGFIGTHIVKQLLESGNYFVRATLRDANDDRKAKHLREMVPNSADRLKLYSADLLTPGSYDEVVKDCKYVFHVAASVTMTAPDPQKDIVDVGVKGTQNVFESVEKSKNTVKRVVMTSSVAAVGRKGVESGHTFTEADWNETATVEEEPYPLEKVLSEKWSIDFVKDKPYDVVHINPGLVIGPVFTEVHLRSSPNVIQDLATGKFPMAPRLSFPIVHVSDVARAHILAAERSEKGTNDYIPGGSRFIMALPKSYWMIEVCRSIKTLYPTFPTPTKELWNWIMYVTAVFDKRINWKFLDHHLGKVTHFNNSKAVSELGIEFRDLESSLKDTIESFIALGYIAPTGAKL